MKRELTICGIARPCGKFANENAMVLLGQVREGWPFMPPLGHVELIKMQKLFKKQKQKPKRKWKTKSKQ